jgi:hypothetical protein
VLAVGLFSLGNLMGITGVALTVDAMAVVGMTILLHRAKAFVDFSASRLFFVPTLGVFAGLLSAQLASTVPGIAGSDWRTAFVKIAVFSVCYLGVLLILERRQTLQMVVYLVTKVLGLSGHRIRAAVARDGG